MGAGTTPVSAGLGRRGLNIFPNNYNVGSVVSSSPRRIPRGYLWLALIFCVVVATEVAAAISLQLVSNSAARFLIWQPDLQQIEQKWVAGQWDDELGWPLPSEATTLLRDASGAKFNPDFSAAETACVSAYGDSFVWGNDIPPRDGWVEQLARKLGCRISNYGVSGYGVDQAFLRFRRTVNDRAPTVILGIYPEAVLRNVNQYRALIGYPTHPAYLKGRFVIDDGGSLK